MKNKGTINQSRRWQRGLTLLLLGVVLALSTVSLYAQKKYELVNISYDPNSDSVFFANMQKKMAEIRKSRPTVALVLAGGGAKGASHIGVLKYLEEKGIPIDFVAGTSMGGLMGGLYAMGYSATEIDSIVRSIDWNVMMSDNIPMDFYTYTRKMYKGTYVLDIPFTKMDFKKSLPSGILYGLNVYNMLSALSVGYQQKMSFLDLPTPYCCVATEIVSQKEKHWTEGSMVDAMRSTMSIPGYFMPVRVDSMILSDGGTKNNFPT
ncbi:MAG: patatin-like phospholipase family protein, partial [Paludibacteraceae bacterium]|nr:patatin-like phospholipase family protein [Paludibacteraceae bacterium]